MPEPLKMVHLTPAQKKRKKFRHPLTDNPPPPLTEKRLDQLLEIYFNTEKEEELHEVIGHEIMMDYLRLLRSTVARYLFYWPVTRRFLDEMISVGAEAITKIIRDLEPKHLETKKTKQISLGGLIESRIRDSIEIMINDFRGIAPAPKRTNYRREAMNKKPIYGLIVYDLDNNLIRDICPYEDISSFIVELENALQSVANTKIEKQVLEKENWGLSDTELGEKIGRSSRRIFEIRRKLRERYEALGEVK